MARDSVGDDAELARVAAALGVTKVAKKAPAKKVAAKRAPAKKTAAKKVAPAKKSPAKKAPAKRTRKQAAKAAAVADPEIPNEVAGEIAVAEPPEIVQGFHELEDPAREAYDLWVQGVPWEEIALRTGYASARSASATVAMWLQRGAIHDGVQAARARAAQALSVTERVKSAFWDQAMAGDKDAASVVLAANRDFFKMAGLEAGVLTINSKRTLIISDNGEGGMAGELRQAALQVEEERRHAEESLQVTSTDDDVR
jgi:hypothetical protein